MKIDKRKIPKGLYCYKNIGKLDNNRSGFKVRICPYLKRKLRLGRWIYFCRVTMILRGEWKEGIESYDIFKDCNIKVYDID